MAHKHLKTVVPALLAIAVAGCGAGKGTPTPTASAETSFTPVVSATGEVLPVRWASLSLPGGGVVTELPVVEGDQVAKGDLLLQLSGREQLEAALAAARLERIQAQQALDQVHESEGVARATAQDALANARDEVRKTEYDRTVQQEGNRTSDDTIKRAKANLVLAEDAVREAKSRLSHTPGKEDSPAKAAATAAYMQARSALDSARRALNWYNGHPTDIQQAMLDADVAVAQAHLAQAQLDWEDVKDGIDPDVLALAEARLEQAKTAEAAAEAALHDSALWAPFDGTISSVRTRPNEWVAPGQPVIDLADLGTFQVQTTDLSEIDAARVRLGAPVTITFDALPGIVAKGKVARIAPKAAEGSGVNYTVWVDLDGIPDGLMWGMTAFVDIEAAPAP